MATRSCEIFSVGEEVAVAGMLRDRDGDLEVVDPASLAAIHMRQIDDVVEIDVVPRRAGLSPSLVTEGLRLAARVARRAWRTSRVRITGMATMQSAALVTDGFQRDTAGGWCRPAGDFLRVGRKATTFEDVYDDPFSVPWNFAPCEVDAYRELQYSPPRHLLDLGCGFGKNSRVLHRWGHHVEAVDLSHTAIRQCRRFVPDVAFMVASAVELPFDDHSFDAVVDVGCLHCMPDQLRPSAVAEVARVLVPGGVLYSRIFKPRDDEWLGAQPFVTNRFGLDDDAALALLGAHFEVRRPEFHPDMHFLRGIRPAVRL